MKRALMLVLRYSVLCCGTLLFCSSVASAMIWSVGISPAQPSAQDTIIFTMEGWFSDGCWSVGDMSFTQLSDHEFGASVLGVDNWQPGSVCIQILVGYLESATLGPLEPGTYTIHVVENHESIREPFPDFDVLTFEVVDFTTIGRLVASPDGDDLVLQWPAVESALEYQVYRAPSAEYELEHYTLIGTAGTPEFRDEGVLAGPALRNFYYVTFTR